MLCQTFHGAEQVEGEVDCPICCHGSGVCRWRYTVQEAALTALWLSREVQNISVLGDIQALVGQGPV